MGIFFTGNGFSAMHIVLLSLCILSLKNKIKTRGNVYSFLKIEIAGRKGRTFMVAYTAQYKWYLINVFENAFYCSRERLVCLHITRHN